MAKHHITPSLSQTIWQQCHQQLCNSAKSSGPNDHPKVTLTEDSYCEMTFACYFCWQTLLLWPNYHDNNFTYEISGPSQDSTVRIQHFLVCSDECNLRAQQAPSPLQKQYRTLLYSIFERVALHFGSEVTLLSLP